MLQGRRLKDRFQKETPQRPLGLSCCLVRFSSLLILRKEFPILSTIAVLQPSMVLSFKFLSRKRDMRKSAICSKDRKLTSTYSIDTTEQKQPTLLYRELCLSISVKLQFSLPSGRRCPVPDSQGSRSMASKFKFSRYL